jgi:hypothetical protein
MSSSQHVIKILQPFVVWTFEKAVQSIVRIEIHPTIVDMLPRNFLDVTLVVEFVSEALLSLDPERRPSLQMWMEQSGDERELKDDDMSRH